MRELLYFLASAGNLFLAILVIFRARRARGALPIALLCIALFVWDIAEAAKPGLPAGVLPADFWSPWHSIRLVGSSMAPAFLWHFVVVFVHKDRALRKWLVALYVATSVFALMTAGSLASEPLQTFVRGKLWNLTYLATLFPFLVWSFFLVRARYREVETTVERNAVAFVAFGIAVGTLTGLTELTAILLPDPDSWRLGHVGSAMCTLVLAIAILRHRLLEEQTPVRQLVYVFLLLLSGAIVLTVLRPPEFVDERISDRWPLYLVFGVVVAVTTLALTRLLFTRLYEQAERRKRLALIGTMAAGVAHEIKNPLASIKGAAQFVQKELEGSDGKSEAREYLKLMVDEVDRLNDVVESFLAYARPFKPRQQDVFLHALLSDILRLESASLPGGVKIEPSLDGDLPPVWGDPALLKHAVTNVLRNAVEAVGESGTVTVGTRTAATALRNFGVIDITDTGPGIKKDHLERIFQPFFTTKSKGTGLGLPIASRILEAHGGELRVQNVSPQGCRFTFMIPVRTL